MGICTSKKTTMVVNGIEINPNLYFKNIPMWNTEQGHYTKDTYDIFICKNTKTVNHPPNTTDKVTIFI